MMRNGEPKFPEAWSTLPSAFARIATFPPAAITALESTVAWALFVIA